MPISQSVRLCLSFFGLAISVERAILCACRGRISALALSISDGEKDIILAENGQFVHIFGGRIHKKCGVGIRLYPWMSNFLDKRITKFFSLGGQVWVKGYAEISWGLKLGGVHSIRLENSIFGRSSQSIDEKIFSYISDYSGIYFDGRSKSDLECILSNISSDFWRKDSFLVSFVKSLLDRNIQKYKDITKEISLCVAQDDVLLVGQVHGDAAVTQTLSLVGSNFELAALAVQKFPNKKIFYKPHPYGSREETIKIIEKYGFAEISPDVSFNFILKKFKSVMVNTSGAGLEAAVRGLTVYTAGVSFYSHWGFTNDFYPSVERRINSLTALDVYVAFLVFYANYAVRNDGLSVKKICFRDYLEASE